MAINVSRKELLAVGLPSYVIGVGVAYTLGYWGTFGLNPLQFMGISELARLAIYPLMATLALAIVLMAANYFFLSGVLPPGGGANSVINRTGRKYWGTLLAILCITIVVTITYAPEPSKWYILAVLVTLFSTPLTHVPRIIELIPSPRVRAFGLLLLIALPALAFAQGRLRAYNITQGYAEHCVDLSRSALPPGPAASKAAYLGYLGGMHVLREHPSGVIVFVKQKEDAPLYLSSEVR